MPEKETLRRRNVSRSVSRSHDKRNSEDTKSGNINYLQLFIGSVILGFVLALTYAYYTSPISASTIFPVTGINELEWANVDNEDLQNGVRLLEELHGPESVIVDKENGYWYTGSGDGKLVRIEYANNSVPTITDISENLINGPYTAGGKITLKRPLALRLHNRTMYLADAYQGIFAIDTTSYKWEKIVGYNDVAPEMKFANDLTVNEAGTKIYFTDVSTIWNCGLMGYMALEGDCSGRVIEVDIATKVLRVIKSGLCVPNGIESNTEETILIVSEVLRNRIILLDIVNGDIVRTIPMPGSPDNIRRSISGGYWVPIPVPTITFLQLTRNLPFVRDIAARIMGPEFFFAITDFSQGMVVKLNEKFEPVSVLKDSKGDVSRAITEVVEVDGGLLLCSFVAHGLVRIDNI